MEPSRQLPATIFPTAPWIEETRMPNAQFEPPGPSLAQIVEILRAYWKVTALIACAALLLAAGVAKFIPKSYKATATLMVSYDVNDPLAAKEIPTALLGSYMATQTDLMQSSQVLDVVIDHLKLTEDPEFVRGNRGGEATIHDWVAGQLRRNIDVEQGHAGSQLIYIDAWARQPDLAANIANAIADVYAEQHFEQMTGPASERARRYADELADLKARITAAQDKLTRLRQRTGLIDLEAKNDVDATVVANLEHKLLDAQDADRLAQSRARTDPAATNQSLASDAVRSLRSEAAALNSRMASLRSNYGPNHPKVVELQSQIDSNERSLNAALENLSRVAAADVQATSQQVGEVEKTLQNKKRTLLESSKIRDEATKYQLELETAQSVYKRALDGYNQVMFASSGQYSNVSVVSHARVPAEAEKRKTVVILLMGAFGGLALGLGATFLYEFFHRRIRCRDDIERDFGIPVLVEFPASARMAA